MIVAHTQQYATYLFDQPCVEELLTLVSNAHSAFGGSDHDLLPIDADIPHPFDGDDLIRSIEANAELMGNTNYVETMLMRIRTLFSDSRMKTIANCPPELTFEKWLEDYICPNNSSDGAIIVIDLSLVPDNLRGLLRELPSLPSQKAILFGWASELPVLVQMNYLEEEYRPQSNDPAYWAIWTNTSETARTVDWGNVAADWQNTAAEPIVEEPTEPLVDEKNETDDEPPF